MDLKERFFVLLNEYTSTDYINNCWDSLHNKYLEPHRKYHNLNHLKELFFYYDKYHNTIENKDSVALAIFYHDIVYEIWKKDNEEKSALNATTTLQKINFPSHQLQIIDDLILCTKNHLAQTQDQGLMIDFDLSILGQSESTYTKYTDQIRKEYKTVPNIIYRRGRKKVLQHFLDKDNIYQTEIFKSLFEKQARINLTKELNQL